MDAFFWVPGILELIGTYTCVPGSWQLKILVPLVLFLDKAGRRSFREADVHIFCSTPSRFVDVVELRLLPKQAGISGSWAWKLDGCQPFFCFQAGLLATCSIGGDE